jgi:two-component system, response regulator PdtaR
MHALIIEDDYLIGRAIEDALSGMGFLSFSFARSQDTAVSAVAADRPDLITADLRLLPGDGIDAVAAIRADRKIPVVFITGFAEDVLERLPDAIVVQKPIKTAELRFAVEQALFGRGSASRGRPAAP